jgi:LysR family transcriptional regulator, transcription activator of glutamate synthase operon
VELRQLEYFLVVAQEGNVTRAARRLYTAQPSLSRQIQKLEEELGAPLFDRSRRGMQLTEVGRTFLQYVERGFGQFEAGRQAVRDLLGPEHGHVRMAFLPAVGADLLPEALAAFRQRYPEVQFTLRQSTTLETLQWLEAGEVELCIATALPYRSASDHLASTPLLIEELYAALPPDHRLSRAESIRLADLADESFVLVGRGSGLRRVIEAACQQVGFLPRVAVEGEDLATVRGLVAAGLGVSLLPALALHDWGRLRPAIVPLRPELTWTIEAVWHAERYLPVATRAFRDFLREYIAAHPPGRSADGVSRSAVTAGPIGGGHSDSSRDRA